MRAVCVNDGEVAMEWFGARARAAAVIELDNEAERKERSVLETSTIVFLRFRILARRQGEISMGYAPEYGGAGAADDHEGDILLNSGAQGSRGICTRIRRRYKCCSKRLHRQMLLLPQRRARRIFVDGVARRDKDSAAI
jgi:hypothetical protein